MPRSPVGVPFINPIHDYDKSDPDNRDLWRTQHNGLRKFDPPYVYNVHQGDLEGLKKALILASQNIIKPFICESLPSLD